MSLVRIVLPAVRALAFSLAALFALQTAACSPKSPDGGPASAPSPKPPQATSLPTGAQSADGPEDGQWLMPAKNYASTRFSGLDQINADNVKSLKVAWTFSTGVNRGHEAATLVVGDMMYVVTPYPNILYALDLKNPGGRRAVGRGRRPLKARQARAAKKMFLLTVKGNF